ncbi:MAG: hypothetical protein ABI729_08800 [Chitinophagales bacterium]
MYLAFTQRSSVNAGGDNGMKMSCAGKILSEELPGAVLKNPEISSVGIWLKSRQVAITLPAKKLQRRNLA